MDEPGADQDLDPDTQQDEPDPENHDPDAQLADAQNLLTEMHEMGEKKKWNAYLNDTGLVLYERVESGIKVIFTLILLIFLCFIH
jgi:hypothetical protein